MQVLVFYLRGVYGKSWSAPWAYWSYRRGATDRLYRCLCQVNFPVKQLHFVVQFSLPIGSQSFGGSPFHS